MMMRIGLLVLGLACCSSTGATPAVLPPNIEATPAVSVAPTAPAPSETAQSADTSRLPTPEDFEEEAKEEVNESNYQQRLDELEREIEEDND